MLNSLASRRVLTLALVVACLRAGDAAALPTPQALYDQAMGNGNLKTSTGEQFTWFAAYSAHSFLRAFEAGGKSEPLYLEKAQAYYDWCNKQIISNDPDGFPGTIGADIGEDLKNKEVAVVADCLVGDANIALPLVHWAELVMADPALKKQFGTKAQEYIDLATRMIWEKWNKRDCYYQDAHGYGSYHTYPFALLRDDRSKWQPRPSWIVSDNLNKHYKAGLVLLSLWKLTGKPEYRDRVTAVFGRAKAMFRLFPDENRLVWNFWMPHGAYDLEGTAPKSWVGVHSSRPGYQVFEAGAFLEVYDAGLVFDRSDIERMVRTNRWMIDNGLQCADGSSKAGGVWDAFAPFDDVIRAAAEKAAKGPLAVAYLQHQLKRNGYERKDVKDPAAVKIAAIPVQPGRKLILAHPIPDYLETANNEKVSMLASIREAGTLTIDLLAADGTSVLGNLATIAVDPKAGTFVAPRWDGTNPKTKTKDPGEYVLRYTLGSEVRTWPVTVKVGVARARGNTPTPLAVGGTLTCDFEQPLDARWTLEGGSELGDAQHKSGAKALRLGRRAKAVFAFGEQDDLPVRITFAAFDGGAKHGKKNDMGQALCLRTANGDLLSIRQAWRGYLNGDADVAWVNTGENQWFNLHPSGLGREPGWNQWTFDCTGGKFSVTRDGKTLDGAKMNPARFVPTGGMALVFLGPDSIGDPELWIDDLTVTYPAAKP
ncbi:MAG: hypothetical protein AAB263_02080 [Planctomycetota bacterium]